MRHVETDYLKHFQEVHGLQRLSLSDTGILQHLQRQSALSRSGCRSFCKLARHFLLRTERILQLGSNDQCSTGHLSQTRCRETSSIGVARALGSRSPERRIMAIYETGAYQIRPSAVEKVKRAGIC